MEKRVSGIVCVSLSIGVPVLFAQSGSSSTSTTPVAIVYVSHPSANQADAPNQIVAYSANAQGQLTKVPGSPFAGNVIPMTVNGKYLFGGTANGSSIDTFQMSSDGALKQVASINAQDRTPGSCDQVIDLVLDHKGATLYSYTGYFGTGSCPADAEYQSFAIESTSGKLSYLGASSKSPYFGDPLRFTGSDVYGFEGSGTDIYGFKRESNGMLVYATANSYKPAAPNGGTYNALYAAANPSNNVAVVLTPNSGSGAAQLATYTANSTGYLSTTSTATNMPKVSVGNVFYTQMDPTGKLLAVAGAAGLQVFHFNGSNPITHYTGLLTTSRIDQMFWDNANHLYAISKLAQKLYVFTVTPTSYHEASGSPVSIPLPSAMVVQPKTTLPPS